MTVLSRFLDGGLRVLDQERLVRTSGFWDAAWYASRYPEAGGEARALSHFLRVGAARGHDPGPAFCTSAYLDAYPDVREAGINALLHYLRFGRQEGRIARDAHGRQTGTAEALGGEALERVRQAFDEDFYRAANPDLGEADAFAHFMGPGWHQRRDPAPWFATEPYLRAHADVAGAGLNPFAHYVLTGCGEGRRIFASTVRRHAVDEPRARPRLAAVAMVRNEADILRSFASHLLALFDDIVIVDHRSDDGSEAFLADLARRNRRVEVLTLEEPSYIQSVTMTHVVRDRPQIRTADWVFLLDADEFLPFATRADFERALASFAGCPAISMRWRNLIPETYWEGEADLSSGTSVLVPPAPSPFRKIAFQPSRVALDRTVVAQGNHALVETLNGVEVPVFDADFPLLHVPVRSVEQILLKLSQGVAAYRRIGRRRDAGQGTHWMQMHQAITGASLTPAHLNALADRYSEEKPTLVSVTQAELLAEGFRVETLTVAQADLSDHPPVRRRGLAETLMCFHAIDDRDAATEDRPGATCLTTEGSRLVRASDQAEYSRLPDLPASPEVLEAVALGALLRPSYDDIADLVPDDWSGHVPFMFSLVGLLRPRRFVEVGTMRGTSFFAALQAMAKLGEDAKGVAVSTWAVEPEREADFAGAYEDFAYLARKYADRAGILRMAPEVALHRFDDGSIDLLHLDGLRGLETARTALDAWGPKLSDRGVILIHDIAAHEAGFGVWRLWEEIKSRAPTLEFRHAQGLGVVLAGKAPPPALLSVARAAADPSVAVLLAEHFQRMGELSAELFSRRYDMAQAEMRGAALGARAEETSWLRQELDSARAEIEELRGLLRGGLARVAGE